MLLQYTESFEFSEAQKKVSKCFFRALFFMLQFLKMAEQNVIDLAKNSLPIAEK